VGSKFCTVNGQGKNELSTVEYRTLRRIILYGKRTKHRIAALTDLIGSPTPPSARLLNELLRQKLPDEFALAVVSLKRALYGEKK
jgi:hypothetical protein